jgi:type I restriction enzyme M protein
LLDTDTKRRIDTARDILVGKVPDPKSQVEQITIALIYKFMDDMDSESEELGGNRTFFTGKFAAYGWAKLMQPGIGGHEMLGLYTEGIAKMPENPGIPVLFREIFKNAYLPYRDPETLKSFLKIINEFTYDHSERLGDAFEYLLSVLGSQGDAGQFRTPRHIIDFIVDIVDPKKGETILDPACGTAGFLISAYKHILQANKDAQGGSTLTPDDRAHLVKNIRGYDISPDMVRLSLVNLYLHSVPDPGIFEYDALTSEDRWNEYADVILANPPFMSPKGGIKPHKRFSIDAKRSEVLFVDYIAEHLTPTGRAGIIVPEGIIFQSQGAYRELRKMLVENSLVAVISLPAGCFNPYSGVKTSILILDKSLARQSTTIGFFKVENDGFGLGAQRREIAKNDLPGVSTEIHTYFEVLRGNQPLKDVSAAYGLVVPKAQIGLNDDYTLSGERYRDATKIDSAFPHSRLGDVARITAGNSAPQGDEYFAGGEVPFIRTSDVGAIHLTDCLIGAADKVNRKAIDEYRLELFPSGTILFPKSGASTFLNHRAVMGSPAYVSSHLACIICDPRKLLSKFAYHCLCRVDARLLTPDQAYPSLRLNDIGTIQIPLPPLEVQQEIVAEIESYQRVIEGARAILDNYRPNIPIEPGWATVQLSEICSFKNGLNFDRHSSGHSVKIVGVGDFKSNLYVPLSNLSTIDLDEPLADEYLIREGDILFVRSNGNSELVGRSMIVPASTEKATFSGFTIRGRIRDERALPMFYAYLFKSHEFAEMIKTVGQGAGIRNISQGILNSIKIPLPPLAIQKSIVAEIEEEQALVAANRELISRFELKIQSTLARVWGDEASPDATV